MSAAEAVEVIRSQFERENRGHYTDLSVTHESTKFGAHWVRVEYTSTRGEWVSSKYSRSISGFSNSDMGKSLGGR